MVAIAQTAGYKGKVARTGTGKAETANLTALLCHLLEQGFPCIVGFDVNATNNYGVHEHSGDPGKSKGDHAHWAVVCGYLVSKAATYFVATHWNKYYCWPANALLESNGQLNRWEKGGDWEKERRVVTSGFLWLRSTTVERSEFSAPGTVKSPVKTNHLPNTDLDMRDLTVVIYPNDPSVVAPTL